MRESSAFRYGTSTRASCQITISLVFAILLLGGCSSFCTHAPVRSISGRVVDPQDRAVEGAEVRLGDRLMGVTDRDGKFMIRAAPTNDRLAVTFSAPKFMSTTQIYEARAAADGNTIIIWPRATPTLLHASVGGRLEFSGGTIMFPPDAFVDTKGRRVTGDVNVSMSVLDIADPRQLASAPGDFTARMRDGSIRNLETFGLFELVIADGEGRRVDLARDRTARVELNVPKERREVPQSVGSFSFDKQSGRWVQRSSTWQLQSSTLSTSLSQDGSSGWWNADQAYDTSCITVQLLGCNACASLQVSVASIPVTAAGSDYTGTTSSKNTDGSGIACLSVKRAAHVDVTVNGGPHIFNVATPTVIASDANCYTSACPIFLTMHVVDAAFSNDALMSYNGMRWCKSDKYWNKAPFGVGWLGDSSHVNFSAAGVTLTLNNTDDQGMACTSSGSHCSGQDYASGEYKTACYHGYGTYTAKITPPAQPTISGQTNAGVITGFFTYTDTVNDGTINPNGTDGHDEVDIELLGRPYDPAQGDLGTLSSCTNNSLIVHTNYFARGSDNNGLNAKNYCLPFGTYTYSFTWTATSITWLFVDNSGSHIIRTENRGSGDWPMQPGRVYMNLWSTTQGPGSWAGAFSYNGALSAVFSNVSVP